MNVIPSSYKQFQKSYFKINYSKPKSGITGKYKWCMISTEGDFICEYNGSRRNAKKAAIKANKQFGIYN